MYLRMYNVITQFLMNEFFTTLCTLLKLLVAIRSVLHFDKGNCDVK